jgi:hypothetical protein
MAQDSAGLRTQTVTRGPVCYIALTGVVDESFDPDSLVSQANGSRVILSLKGITRLSSFGVREWTNAMKRLCEKVERVFLVECAPPVVSQLNMVTNFGANAQILSVMAPYYCESCGAEQEVKVEVTPGVKATAPEITCKCGTKMEFDEDPDAYFSFPPANVGERPNDPAVYGMLRHLGLALSEEMPIPRGNTGAGLGGGTESDPTVVPGRIPSGTTQSGTGANQRKGSAPEGSLNQRAGSGTDASQSRPLRTITQSSQTQIPAPGFAAWLNRIVDRHWQVFLGLAIVVMLLALLLLLIRQPPAQTVGLPTPTAQTVDVSASAR